MKKIFALALSAVVLTLIASCSHTNSASPNSYTFKGTSYNAATITASVSGGVLQATNLSATNTVNITNTNIAFGAFPTTSGSYRVVNYNNTPASNEVVIGFADAAGTTYFSTGSENQNATVTVNNGKVSISVPNVWLQSTISQSDSGQYSAHFTQP